MRFFLNGYSHLTNHLKRKGPFGSIPYPFKCIEEEKIYYQTLEKLSKNNSVNRTQNIGNVKPYFKKKN